MKIAVFFDGAGLARLGLEQAGHECVGFELDERKHLLSKHIGKGNVVLADVRDVDLSSFDAVWASPPCQIRSSARTQGAPTSAFAVDLLEWSLRLKDRWPHLRVLWVENIMSQRASDNTWGTAWNAAQFDREPRQNRNRVIGGDYPTPFTYHEYKRAFDGVCPCVTASEYKGCATDKRRASRYYGRRLTVAEAAYRMGLIDQPDVTLLPAYWQEQMATAEGRKNLYEAIGNGVPVWMAYAFGKAARNADQASRAARDDARAREKAAFEAHVQYFTANYYSQEPVIGVC